MSTLNLHRVINPQSVAVVGASSAKGSVGAAIMTNMVSGGFKGDIFPVNPKYDAVMGLTTCPDVNDLPKAVDMAVIATPIATVPDMLMACSKNGMGGAVIISAGDDVSTAPGKKIGAQILEISKKTGLRIIGPDSVGMVNTALGMNASFMHRMPLPGKIAFLSQSGAVCTSVLDMAMGENVGFSHFVSLGSMPDVCFADMIDFLGSLYEVDSIVMYVERLVDIRNFMSAARAVSRVKPIIALKSDRFGPEALICEDDVYDAAFKRAGILRVKDFEALFDCVEFLAKQKRPRGSRLAIVSNAGGIGVMAKDALAFHNIKPAQLSGDTMDALETVLNGNWSRTNPIDFLRTLSNHHYIETVKICMNAPEIDGLLLLSSPVGIYDCAALAGELVPLLKTSPCPVFTSWMGGFDIDHSRIIFNQAGIATYETPERAVQAFVNLYQYGKNIELLQQIPYQTDKRLEINRARAREIIEQGISTGEKKLADHLAKELVAAYGIPVGSHKTGQTADYELTISAVRLKEFGPVIRFGMGGIMTEVFKDVSIALPPLNRPLARTAIEETQISKIFSGYKNIQPLDIAQLEEILIRMSRLVTDFPEIKTVDINPVRVKNGQMIAAHGRVTIEKMKINGSGHLVISPYPFWQETRFKLKGNETIFARPVRPSDAEKMIDLFYDLSPETVYLRFFSPIKRISRSMLIKLTQIDYDREIALIAFCGSKKDRKIVGVSRIVFESNGRKGEFAVVLADSWQKKGLGKKLLYHALACAGKYGLEKVWGPVMTGNVPMLKLGEKLGFKVERDMDSSEYKLTIDLPINDPIGFGGAPRIELPY
ncbi:MAG: GNAT family N-acetyltransferase [Proteobacteria bacterium]|nr:GNAT family N-acetyltransferase [Pseudomonadota bacterium]MBU1584994.1 GNAT family N-acetyltransferase [Pseudomonadota bacterium]MBU2454441.1 GNAT family N-acetyltransferase [Pseudomonadota bacterium]MBU2631644.1 GNAT family N-acetyltransferase [Pseudomonadota bacterium]